MLNVLPTPGEQPPQPAQHNTSASGNVIPKKKERLHSVIVRPEVSIESSQQPPPPPQQSSSSRRHSPSVPPTQHARKSKFAAFIDDTGRFRNPAMCPRREETPPPREARSRERKRHNQRVIRETSPAKRQKQDSHSLQHRQNTAKPQEERSAFATPSKLAQQHVQAIRTQAGPPQQSFTLGQLQQPLQQPALPIVQPTPQQAGPPQQLPAFPLRSVDHNTPIEWIENLNEVRVYLQHTVASLSISNSFMPDFTLNGPLHNWHQVARARMTSLYDNALSTMGMFSAVPDPTRITEMLDNAAQQGPSTSQQSTSAMAGSQHNTAAGSELLPGWGECRQFLATKGNESDKQLDF